MGGLKALWSDAFLAVLLPNRGFFHEEADVEAQQGGQDPDPQHAPPADLNVEQPIDEAREQEAEAPGALQQAAHDAARSGWPGLHGEGGARRPFRAHADAKGNAEEGKDGKAWREAGGEVADRVPQDGDHQRRLAADPVAKPAGAESAEQAQP